MWAIVKDVLTTDAALIAVFVIGERVDRCTGGRLGIGRAIRAAVILAGVDGVAVPSWRQPVALVRAVAALVRAAWHGGQSSLPRWARVALVLGFVVPILGPVDEIAGLLTLAVVAVTPSHRRTVAAAWQVAA